MFVDSQLNQFKRMPLKSRDVVVRFNYGQDYRLFSDRCDMLFTRWSDKVGFAGMSGHKHHKYNIDLENIYGICRHKEILENSNFINKLNTENYEQLSKVQTPTTGLIGLLYCIDRFPGSEIILLGFDLHRSSYHNESNMWALGGHEFNKEYRYIEKLIKQHPRIKWFKKEGKTVYSFNEDKTSFTIRTS